MKKIILLLCFSLMLTACTVNTNSDTEQKSTETTETTEITTAAETETTSATEPITEPPTETVIPKTWQEAYRLEIIKAADTIGRSSNVCFSIEDLNNDGTPELIISKDTTYYAGCRIYTFNDNIISIGNHGTFGNIAYCKEKNIVMSGDADHVLSYFLIKNDSIEHIAKFYDNSGTSQPIEYKINDKLVSENEYVAAIGEYDELKFKELGRDFPLSADVFDSVTGVCNDWKKAYKSLLENWSCTAFTRFSVCDINADNTPELIISEGDYHFAVCKVYSFDNTLISLGKLGSYGNIGYDPDINMIYAHDIQYGFEISAYYTIDENYQLQCEIDFYNNKGHVLEDEEVQYEINGDLVSYEEYQNTLENYQSDNLKWLGLEYEIFDSTINECLK